MGSHYRLASTIYFRNTCSGIYQISITSHQSRAGVSLKGGCPSLPIRIAVMMDKLIVFYKKLKLTGMQA